MPENQAGLVRRAYIADIERAEDGSMTVVISNGAVDRFNTILDPEGWDLKNYKSNPVVMWAHQREQLPIAKCKRVWVDGNKLKAEVDWSDSVKLNPFAAQVKAYYDAGLLRGWSVGFIPHETEYPDTSTISVGRGSDTKQKPTTFRKMELVEFSAAPIPANPGTLSENALLSRTIGETAGIDPKFLELVGAAIPEGSRKSEVFPEWIAGVYERSINSDVPGSSSGRTSGSGPENGGSNPSPGATGQQDDERDYDPETDKTEDRPNWSKQKPGGKGREETPSHVFLMPDQKKYPYKQKKGGQWIVSCKDLRDAISVANGQGDKGVAKKAQSIYAKNCASKSWSGTEALDRTWKWAGRSVEKFQKACAFPLDAAVELAVGPLVHHDVENGSLQTSYLGVREALASLLTEDAEVRSTEPARTAYAHLEKHWAQFGMPTPDIGLEDEGDMDEEQREAARDLLEQGDVEGALEVLDRGVKKRDGFKDPGMEDTPASGKFRHRHARKLRAAVRAIERAGGYVGAAMTELLARQNEDQTKKEKDPNAPPFGGPTVKTARDAISLLREAGVVGEKGEAVLLERAEKQFGPGKPDGSKAGKVKDAEDKYADQGGKVPMKAKSRKDGWVETDDVKADKQDQDDDVDEAKLKKALTEAGMDAEQIEKALGAWRKLPKAQKAARKEPVDGDQKHGSVLPGQEDDEFNDEADANDPGAKGPHGRKVVDIKDTPDQDEEAMGNAGDKDPDQKRKRARKRDADKGTIVDGEESDDPMDAHDPGKKGPHGRFVDLLKDLGLDESEIETVVEAARGMRRQRTEKKYDVGQGGPDADDDDKKGGKAPGPARKRARRAVEKSLQEAGFDEDSIRDVLEAWDRNQDSGMVAAGEEDDEMMQDHDPTPEPHKVGAGKKKQDDVIKMADGVELREGDEIELEVEDVVEDR